MPRRLSGRKLRSPLLFVVVVQVTFVALSLYFLRASGPLLYTDEASFLGMAVDLSDRTAFVSLRGNPFSPPGYSLAIAPLLSVSSIDPWAAGVIVNVVAFLGIGPILYLLARRAAGASDRLAAAAAIAGATVPGLGINLTRTWSEVYLTFLISVWALVLWEFLSRRRPREAAGLALVTVLLWITHSRTAAVIALSAAVLALTPIVAAWLARRRSTSASPGETRPRLASVAATSGLGIGLFVVGSILAAGLDARTRERLYPGGSSTAKRAGGTLDRFLTADTLERAVGHLWTTQIVTLGFAGLVLYVVCSSRFSPTLRVWTSIVLAAFGGTLLVSTAFLGGDRVDAIVYERYIGPFFPVLIALGVVTFARLGDRRMTAARFSFVATGAIFLAMIVIYTRAAFAGSLIAPTIPTLAAWDLLGGDRTPTGSKALDVGVMTVAAVLAGLAVTWLGAKHPARSGLAVGALSIGLLVANAHWVFQPYFNPFEGAGENAADLFEAESITTYGVVSGGPPEMRNTVLYATGYLRTVPVSADRCPEVEYFIAPETFEPKFAAKRIRDLQPFGGGVWERLCEPTQ